MSEKKVTINFWQPIALEGKTIRELEIPYTERNGSTELNTEEAQEICRRLQEKLTPDFMKRILRVLVPREGKQGFQDYGAARFNRLFAPEGSQPRRGDKEPKFCASPFTGPQEITHHEVDATLFGKFFPDQTFVVPITGDFGMNPVELGGPGVPTSLTYLMVTFKREVTAEQLGDFKSWLSRQGLKVSGSFPETRTIQIEFPHGSKEAVKNLNVRVQELNNPAAKDRFGITAATFDIAISGHQR